jgi:glycogen synthase
MQKSKILFISNIFPPHVRGGYELGCFELAEKYTKLGYSVIVASSENTPELKKYPDPTHLDVRRIFSPVRYYDDKYNYHFQTNPIYLYEKVMAFAGYIEYNCISLKRLIEIEKPDLIWIFNPLGIGPLGILDTVLSCKAKVIIHLMEHLDNVIQDYSKFVNLTAKWKYLKSQITAISCSQKIIESSSNLGEYYSNTLIYNWVDLDKYCYYLNDINSRINQKNENTFNLVYFGQLAEKKGVKLLYDLAKHISKTPHQHKIAIDVYGGGEKNFVDWLKNEISNDDNLSKIFHLKGFLPKESLLHNISQYDMALFPLSDDEPFGYAPIEAMLTGVPVMITSKTGVSELLQDGYDAIFIKDRNNITKLYKKIIWCIENQDELDKIKHNAIRTIKANCDLEMVTLPSLNKLIEEVVPNSGYSFDHVLNICAILKYPYFDLSVKNHLAGARYKFIDKVVDLLYRHPFIRRKVQSIIKYILEIRRKNS